MADHEHRISTGGPVDTPMVRRMIVVSTRRDVDDPEARQHAQDVLEAWAHRIEHRRGCLVVNASLRGGARRNENGPNSIILSWLSVKVDEDLECYAYMLFNDHPDNDPIARFLRVAAEPGDDRTGLVH